MPHRPTAQTPGIDIPRLAGYLAQALPDYDHTAPLTATLLTGGRSNLTCLLSQSGGQSRADRHWVLRRPPLGHVMPSAHDMAREYRTLTLLSRQGFPVPRPLALCEDRSVLGVTFLIMEYMTGMVLADGSGTIAPDAGEAGHLCGEMVRTLAQLHQIPVPDPGPNRSTSSRQYLRRQVVRWTQQWQHTRTRDLPAFEELSGWLTAAIDQLCTDYPITFVHGDYRLDNLVLDAESMDIRAVLDWEMSTFGDPLLDLALLLVYWQEPGDRLRRKVAVALELTTAPGFWSRQRLVDEYARRTGLPMDNLEVCLALACLKLAVVMESVHYRHVHGQALDELSAGLADAAPALLRMGLNVSAGAGLTALGG